MKKKQPKQAFTLIELLTVIAIIGILASILIPTVGRVRESARRTVDASNIRQIGQASLIYANDNKEQLPPRGGAGKRPLTADGELAPTAGGLTPDIHAIAGALARSGGLNDASIWISNSDKWSGTPPVNPTGQTTVLTGTTTKTITPEFKQSGVSFAYIAGRSTAEPSSRPIAFTRGLLNSGGNGKWVKNGNHGVYGEDGGHIVFLGGNVSFYKDVGANAQEGIFTNHSTDVRTNAIIQTVNTSQAIYSLPGGPSGQPAGQPGV